jgi:hypothetical protein
MAVAPDIPTFGEMRLPALSFSQWVGFFRTRGHAKGHYRQAQCRGGRGTSRSGGAISARRSRTGDFPRERQIPEALGALVKSDAEKWWPIIKELGIKGQ